MAEQSYHHGNLRVALLEHAEELLRVSGVDALSLRELARRAGVSHGAPRAHFADRQALLDALAIRGFDRLAASIRAAVEHRGPVEERFRLVAHAYVDFAVNDAALMELMFTAKIGHRQGAVQDAAVRLFAILDGALQHGSADADGDRERFKLVFAAMMQGAASLIVAHRVTAAQGARIVEDAADALLESRLGAQAVLDAPPRHGEDAD